MKRLRLPARRVGNSLHARCFSCDAVHVHEADDPHPEPLCEPGSLGSVLGYDIVVVSDATDDELLCVAVGLWLASSGWRQAKDQQSWLHATHGRRSTSAAALLQQRLDAVHAYQLGDEPAQC